MDAAINVASGLSIRASLRSDVFELPFPVSKFLASLLFSKQSVNREKLKNVFQSESL